jgi:CheY-specific phosphatase CheX
MQAIELKPFMESAVAEVLESMCFISSEGEATDEQGGDRPDWIRGELKFAGVPGGTFGIAVPPSTAALMAANFLGEDEVDLTDEQTVEVVCELTNMVCGTLLAQMDSRQAFTLSTPRHVLPGTESPVKSDRIEGTYATDEGLIHTWLELQATA